MSSVIASREYYHNKPVILTPRPLTEIDAAIRGAVAYAMEINRQVVLSFNDTLITIDPVEIVKPLYLSWWQQRPDHPGESHTSNVGDVK